MCSSKMKDTTTQNKSQSKVTWQKGELPITTVLSLHAEANAANNV